MTCDLPSRGAKWTGGCTAQEPREPRDSCRQPPRIMRSSSLLFRNPSRHPSLGAHPNSDLPKDGSDLELPGEVSEAWRTLCLVCGPVHTPSERLLTLFQFSSVVQSCPTLRPHGLQHPRLPCPSPTPRACSNLCPSSQ